tara:strand:+ start:1182 stop:1799 length:618 start_codon:yes stop_codon:yes gene_type:complete
MKIIPPDQLMKIPIKDNNEELVDIVNACSGAAVYQGREDCALLRKTVAEKLNHAHSSLPGGYMFRVFEAYRPLAVQKQMYDELLESLRQKNTDWDEHRLRQEANKFVAPLEMVPPHSTGGAIDLTIVNRFGNELDMGTRYLEFCSATHTDSPEILGAARENRDLLIKAMSRVDFANHPAEWWHWSFGDRTWAGITGNKISFYGGK